MGEQATEGKHPKNTELLKSQLVHPPAPRQVQLFPAFPVTAYLDSS